jgi:hypothetical protein
VQAPLGAVPFYPAVCQAFFKPTVTVTSSKLSLTCAQSAGTKYKGSRKNTLGDVSCFSFFPTKKEKLRFLPEDGALLHSPSIV